MRQLSKTNKIKLSRQLPYEKIKSVMKLSFSMKESFQTYRNCQKSQKVATFPPSQMYLDSEVASTDGAKAKLFSRYFQSVFSKKQYNKIMTPPQATVYKIE